MESHQEMTSLMHEKMLEMEDDRCALRNEVEIKESSA